MNFLTIGEATYDINILLDKFLQENTKTNAKEIITCCGGSACITSFALAKWNVESYISAILGNDENATNMRNLINNTRVKTNFLETDYETLTPITYLIHNKENNSTSKILSVPSELHIKRHEYDLPMDCVITDGTKTNASIYALNKYSNSVTILNAKTPDKKLLEIFKYVKIAILSGEVAEAMTDLKIDLNNPSTLVTIYKKISEKYPHLNLIIFIKNKGTIYKVNNEIKFIAAINEQIIDTTGSHDIFVAGFAYGLMNKLDIETTIRFATIAENYADKQIGSTLSIPLLSDIITYYESKFGKINLNLENNNMPNNVNNAPAS